MRIATPRMDICPPVKCLEGIRDLGEFGRNWVYPTAIVLDTSVTVRSKMDRGMGVEGGLESAVVNVMRAAELMAGN